ncbi:MAG: aminotransferase [Firmicutes bacterium HGW-Firmicutes-2]|jgi:aspartate/methionine/tyrosine aminotransferase|nr:MAG: aminotransferase [Firmicutes bacterium HGW-Firmicutes-2]
MAYYSQYSKESLDALRLELEQQLKRYESENHDLNMARGKPCSDQLDLSNALLDIKIPLEKNPNDDFRNYGTLDGIPQTKKLFADLLEVDPSEIIIGGNSSLNMMYSTLAKVMLFGTSEEEEPWCHIKDLKFLCPVPGYDRHFAICQKFGMEMINIDMTDEGPDMDQVEFLVAKDPSIKGIWCVPKFSNPTGITYSDQVVERLAKMKTAATDFRIIWDNAYVVHELYNDTEPLMNIMEACKAAGTEDRPYLFTSMSKVTFAGASVAAMAASKNNIDFILGIMGVQTIGSDKINQYRHSAFLKDLQGVKDHMKKHAKIIKPKFDMVLKILDEKLSDRQIAVWSVPRGGYFINLDVMDGCAKEVVLMAESVGLKLTPAGATYPYGNDPYDRNIRIAPTFPPMDELEKAIEILCVCIELVSINKYLQRFDHNIELAQ